MGLNVLIADDEPAVVRVLSRLLERAGHSVRTASTAEEALALIDSEPFDVALVDHNMPGDGHTVLEALARREDFDGRMLLMSGELPEGSGDLPPGARRLQKPFQVSELVALVEGR